MLLFAVGNLQLLRTKILLLIWLNIFLARFLVRSVKLFVGNWSGGLLAFSVV